MNKPKNQTDKADKLCDQILKDMEKFERRQCNGKTYDQETDDFLEEMLNLIP